MKRVTNFLLLSAMAFGLLAACNQPDEPYTPPTPDDNPVDKPEDKPVDNPEDTQTPKAGTYKFVASDLQGSWKAGDQIYVHGNVGTEAEVITLAAGDISADGKTATAKVTTAAETPVDPDGLYAAWPADAVYEFKGILKVKTTFQNCQKQLTIAYLKDDTFQFIDVSSLISFTVNGDYDQFALAGNDRAGLNIIRFEVEYSSAKKTFNYKLNDGYPFLYGNIQGGSAKIWLPGDFSFKEGYTIFLGKGDKWTAMYKVDGKVDLTAGQEKNLGNISGSLTAYEGLPPRMPRQGDHKKYTVKFNELSGLCLTEDQDLLWSVGDDGDLAKLSLEGEVLYKFHIGGDAEAVSRNPETGDLLIGLEPDGVGVVKGPDFNTRVSTLFSIPKASNYGNAGTEGLTYYKDGLIFVGTQTDSRLFLCDLKTKKVLWDNALYNKERVSEIADLCYDPLTGWLWIIDSESKKVYVFAVDHSETDGKWSVSMDYVGAYPVDGSNPESVCVDHKHSCIWVGDDYGSTSYLFRYEFEGLDDFNL